MIRYLFSVFIYSFIINFNYSQDLILGDYIPGNGLVFSSTDQNYKVVLRGYSQSLFESKTRFFDSSNISDNNVYNRFRARRVRLRLSGNQLFPGFSYRLQVDLAQSVVGDGELSGLLLDAWVGYNITKKLKIIFGQKATPTDNLSVQMASNSLQLPERSRLTSAFASIREVGLFMEGKFKTGEKSVLKSMLCITNGDGSNTLSNDFGGLKYGARINFLPFGTFRNFGQFRQVDMVRELSPKLMLGINGSYNVGMSSRRGRENGDFVYYKLTNNNGLPITGQNEFNSISDIPDYITKKIRLPTFIKYGADLLFKYRGFSLITEFIKTKAIINNDINFRRNRYNNDNPDEITNNLPNAFDDGNPGSTSHKMWANYLKSQMMLGLGLNIQAGYLFKNLFSIDGRVTSLNPDEYSFMNNTSFYNRNKYYTIGISKYFSKNYSYKIQASYTLVDDAIIRDLYSVDYIGSENILRLMVQIAF